MAQKEYVVTFDATKDVYVDADNAEEAQKLARAQLDPDVDWEFVGVDVNQDYSELEGEDGENHNSDN